MNTRSHLFKVKRGRLYYDNKPIGTCKCHPGFERLYFEKDPLSEEGANGVIFRASHRILDIQQAVKVWRPEKASDFKRAKNEAKKNANRDLGNSVAHINDAGIYEYPSDIFFAVMEIVNNARTLKEWRKSRNKSLQALNQHAKLGTGYTNSRKLHCYAQALNVAAGTLLCMGTLYENNMTHGDLHEGNLLIVDNEDTRTDLLQFPNVGKPGTLRPADIRIIDIGTSKATGTARAIGERRDVDKLIENTRAILAPLLTHFNTSLSKWLLLTKIKGTSETPPEWRYNNTQISSKVIAGDLLRLVVFLNLILGFVTKGEHKAGSLHLDKDDLSKFNQSMLTIIPGSHIYLDQGDHLNALIYYSTVSFGNTIDWPKVWKCISLKYPEFSPYTVSANPESDYLLSRRSKKSSTSADAS